LQFQVTNSPFNQEQADLLNRLLPTLSESQQIWLSGYLSARLAVGAPVADGANSQAALPTLANHQPVISQEVTVLFGSQTGNSQRLAKALASKLEGRGFQVTLSSMSNFKTNSIKKINNLLLLVSTHGEGDPPDNALPFYEFLFSKRAPKLEDLRYSVLSLGDSSYEFFCKTGKDFDQRLEELGSTRITPRTDCDLDYDEPADAWMESVLTSLSGSGSQAQASQASGVNVASNSQAAQSAYSRTNPFDAEVLENINLNGRGSSRETHHLEISLEGSNLQYEPGDSLGVFPQNHPLLVDEIIVAMGWQADEPVQVNKQGDVRSLREALLNSFEITVLTKPLVEQAAKLAPSSKLGELLESGHEDELRAYIKERDLLDLVQDYSLKGIAAVDFVAILRKLPARLYSIASSYKANPDEVHLTVRTVRYEAHGRERYGVASVQFAERVQAGDTLPVYIHENPNFKLPANPETPMIMIGPGTGVAPFRAFLQEREELGAEGNNWLFYGDQHLVTDFLYQLDWRQWLTSGLLTHLDVAFSRDTDQKVYVQHRMLAKSKEIFQWLSDGAHVYVCGDEKHMAHDVHNALLTIIEREGAMSSDEAAAYLTNMQQQNRYQRDVY
jgi:sulfite reductase (NADPH) flavoprotein alpha-component